MPRVSKLDEQILDQLRSNVAEFVEQLANKYDLYDTVLLDVAPQDHEGAAPYFQKATIETLDIDAKSGATYIADLCTKNDQIVPSDNFHYVLCTEVLEHTRQPFNAVNEIRRMLKPGGLAFISTPFNFRIHGPLPDCWRFTEHGLRELFRSFEILELTAFETQDRFLMPIQYTLVARKPLHRPG